MIKGSDEMQKLIPRKGEFNAMMDGFASVVDEDTAAEMRSSFSLEHLRELASKQIKDFGGDFLRKMNGDDKWVNMAFIIDESLTKEEGILVFRQIDTENSSRYATQSCWKAPLPPQMPARNHRNISSPK